ncbi:MAG: FKBP-type peptidyl-prolyl cis-trans isomerase N-terminal domain-containing protein, partial [Planctomycetia bacterium]
MSPRRSLRMWVWFLSAAILPVVALAQPPAAEVSAAPAEAKPADLDTPEGRLGYALGLRIGSRIAADFKTQNAPLDAAALARGLADAVLGIQPRLDEKKIAAALEGFEARMRDQEREFAKRMAEVAKVNKAKAAEFLKANAAKQGVITLP